tara:strand:+ start:174 stop:650 length:477 start_codon:yes stop_codon:yes gene_type:complete
MSRLKINSVLVLSLALTLGYSAQARIYQWVDPVTGSIQMAGKPPAWYRSSWDGPRVRVTENGHLVDDTAIEVSKEEMQALRDEAFRQFAETQKLTGLKHLENIKLEQEAADDRLRQLEDTESSQSEKEAVAELSDDLGEDTIQQLKELIDQWDSLSSP